MKKGLRLLSLVVVFAILTSQFTWGSKMYSSAYSEEEYDQYTVGEDIELSDSARKNEKNYSLYLESNVVYRVFIKEKKGEDNIYSSMTIKDENGNAVNYFRNGYLSSFSNERLIDGIMFYVKTSGTYYMSLKYSFTWKNNGNSCTVSIERTNYNSIWEMADDYEIGTEINIPINSYAFKRFYADGTGIYRVISDSSVNIYVYDELGNQVNDWSDKIPIDTSGYYYFRINSTDYLSKKENLIVTIDYPEAPEVNIPENESMMRGDTLDLSKCIEFYNHSGPGRYYKGVSYSSDNTEVATVNSEGKVEVVGYGEAIITVIINENIIKTCHISVKEVEVTVTPSITLDFELKREMIFVDSKSGEHLRDVEFKSLDENIATVKPYSDRSPIQAPCWVYPIKPGKTKIEVTINGGTPYYCNVTVKKPAIPKVAKQYVKALSGDLYAGTKSVDLALKHNWHYGKFEVYRSTRKKSGYKKVKTIKFNGATYIDDSDNYKKSHISGMKPNKKYYFKARFLPKYGKKYSKFSKPVAYYTAAKWKKGRKGKYISWKKTKGAKYYAVEEDYSVFKGYNIFGKKVYTHIRETRVNKGTRYKRREQGSEVFIYPITKHGGCYLAADSPVSKKLKSFKDITWSTY